MNKALVINNHPVCPKCKETSDLKLKVIDADSVSINNEKYFEINMKCRSCNTNSYYFLDLEMGRRFSIDKENGSYKKLGGLD